MPTAPSAVLEQRRRRVLGLHRLRPPPRHAPHRRGRARQVAEQVERVRRLVHQHAAAFALPRAAPARRAVVRVRTVERVDDRRRDERPEPALAISSRAAAITGRKRCWKHTPSSRPARSAAAIIASASRASGASGFSHRTCAPVSSAAIVERSACDGCGVATTTTSGSSASSSSMVGERAGSRTCCARADARSVVVRRDPDELDVVERRDRVEMHLRDDACTDQAVAQRHASSRGLATSAAPRCSPASRARRCRRADSASRTRDSRRSPPARDSRAAPGSRRCRRRSASTPPPG